MRMDKELRLKIGAEIRAYRTARGLTTRQLGEMCCLAHSHIVRIENGKYNLRIDTLEAIARALGVELVLREPQQ